MPEGFDLGTFDTAVFDAEPAGIPDPSPTTIKSIAHQFPYQTVDFTP